jgi:hypothetical protein
MQKQAATLEQYHGSSNFVSDACNGFISRAIGAADHPVETLGAVGGSAVIGGGLAFAAKNPELWAGRLGTISRVAPKIMIPLLVLDLAVRTYQASQSKNPGEVVGSTLFDYGLCGLSGSAGYKLGGIPRLPVARPPKNVGQIIQGTVMGRVEHGYFATIERPSLKGSAAKTEATVSESSAFKTVKHPNGDVVLTWKSTGTKSLTSPDGVKISELPNGDVHMHDPTGARSWDIVFHAKGGQTQSTLRYKVEITADGEVYYLHRLGSSRRRYLPPAREVRYDCGKIAPDQTEIPLQHHSSVQETLPIFRKPKPINEIAGTAIRPEGRGLQH